MILAKEFEGELWIKASLHNREVKRAVEAEREAVLQTIDALYEPEETPMFVEGYDAALDHIKQFIEGRNK
jgi:hypothetical protein